MISFIRYIRFLFRRTFVLVLLLLIAQGSMTELLAQKERVRMKFYFAKNDSGDRFFTIALSSGSGRNMQGVKNAEVLLSAVFEDSTVTLATVVTDTLGEVKLYLEKDYVLPVDEDGKTHLLATYEGDEQFRSVESEITIADLDFEFIFEEIDSVKYLNVLATTKNADGEKVPVEDLNINIGIQRLFSVLPLDDMVTDEDGMGELEIPDDLPGDSEGLITFVANIEDDATYGTVTKKGSHAWGVPVSYELKPLPRQLFTDEAPIWMIASVFIILLGAWYHFFLSISKLIKLKKAG